MVITLKLTQEQLNVVAAGLNELPFKTAAPVVSALQAQLRAAAAPPPAPEVPAPVNDDNAAE